VEVSDFADWRSVVNWALPLYESTNAIVPPELRDLITGWEASAGSDEEKARQALQFVQDSLRYTGIELGPDSYRPTNPLETFQKRYGDCKGKAALLCFLLRQMNIEAYPALVNSSDHEAIQYRLPTPFAFDHCIAKIRLNGKDVWVDPTRTHQGGLIFDRYVSPFGKALVIRPGNDHLDDMPPVRPQNAWQQHVTSTFFINNYKSPVKFTVRTEYYGASADQMRNEAADSDVSDQAKNYLNYYARLYPGILSAAPPKIDDDRRANVVTVSEVYTLTNLWVLNESGKLWKATFYPDNLYNALTDPDTRLRKTPLALEYPLLRKQEIVVHLPDKDWQIPDLSSNLENENFSFNYRRHLSGSMIVYNYECRTKQSIIPVASVPDYLVKREHVSDLLSDTLQRPDENASKEINWLMVVVACFGAGTMAVGCTTCWRRMSVSSEITSPISVSGESLQGLGGWLVIVGFGLCLGPILRVFQFGHLWEGFFSAQVWQTLAMPGGEKYHPLYGPLLIYELLGNIFLLGLNLFVLCLFFTKRRAFPKVYIMLIIANAVFLIIDHFWAQMIPHLRAISSEKYATQAFRAAFYATIWTLYMLKSKRVKATFIR
jgi:hypothetical protein